MNCNRIDDNRVGSRNQQYRRLAIGADFNRQQSFPSEKDVNLIVFYSIYQFTLIVYLNSLKGSMILKSRAGKGKMTNRHRKFLIR